MLKPNRDARQGDLLRGSPLGQSTFSPNSLVKVKGTERPKLNATPYKKYFITSISSSAVLHFSCSAVVADDG